MSVTKNKKSTIKRKIISARGLATAFIDILYLNKRCKQIKITMKQLDNNPDNVSIICSGKGTLRGKVMDGTFCGTIKGTPTQIKAWKKFFSKFDTVPVLSLAELSYAYVNFCSKNNDNHEES